MKTYQKTYAYCYSHIFESRMKFYLYIALIFILGCNSASKEDSQIENIPDSLLTNYQLMQKELPQIIEFSKDEKTLSFNTKCTSVEILKRNPYLIIGKFIDSVRTFAISYDEKDSLFEFFRLDNTKWKRIGKEKNTISFGDIYFEELNGKKNLEIIVSTSPNINGNCWRNIYSYFDDKDSVKFAGAFCCDFKVDLNRRIITEVHEGSRYMDLYKTVYGWHQDTLIPLRHVRLTPIDAEKPGMTGISKYKISYWENTVVGYTSQYKQVFNEVYQESNKKHKKYWEDFFDIKYTDAEPACRQAR